MKRILLTGATGFVGKQIFKSLCEQGVEVVPVVRVGKESVFDNHSNVIRLVTSNDVFQQSADWWECHCQDIDVVIHAAWYAEPGRYLHSPVNLSCLIGSLNLAKGAATAGVKRFVGVGTCFEYDLSAGLISIETALNPLNAYSSAKAGLYISLSRLLPNLSVQFAWCRLFYLHGEGEDERRLVAYLHKQLRNGEVAELTSGSQIRDYLDVSDAGRIIANVALGEQGGPVNVCSGTPISVRELAERISDQYARRSLLRFGVRQDNPLDPPYVVGIPNY